MWAVSDDENVLASGVSDPEPATVDYESTSARVVPRSDDC